LENAASSPVVGPLALVNLGPLMERTCGRAEVRVGLIDGPVASDHPELAGVAIRETSGTIGGGCARPGSFACTHGTFVAGILAARRGSPAPAICPGCTLLVRPIFGEATSRDEPVPGATPTELAAALLDCLDAGAQIINLSAALVQPSLKDQGRLDEALHYAGRRGVIVVAAAGNQGMVGGSTITRHPWVVPVVACDLRGRPLGISNLGRSVGTRGLRAPGDAITSLGAGGDRLTLGGTSVATPFVTGSIALLWSEFPAATAAAVRFAATRAPAPRRAAIVPPLLDAWAAYQSLAIAHSRRRVP
jgi:subtilisin family serine protease